MDLGKRLRHCRKQKGYTLEELGEKAGVSYKYIGEIERGVKTPSVTVLQKLASALEVHASLLLSSSEMEETQFLCLHSITCTLYGMDLEKLNKISRIIKITT